MATPHRPCSPKFCGQRLRSPEWPKSTTARRFACCWLSQTPVVPTRVSPRFAVCPLCCTPAAPPTSSLFSTQQPKSPLRRLPDCALLLQLSFGSPHRNSQCPHRDQKGTRASPPCPRAHPAQLGRPLRSSTVKPGCSHPGPWHLLVPLPGLPFPSCTPSGPRCPATLFWSLLPHPLPFPLHSADNHVINLLCHPPWRALVPREQGPVSRSSAHPKSQQRLAHGPINVRRMSG